MSLDISTLYVIATLVSAMLGTMLLFFWRKENIPALGWWGAAYILAAIAIGVWSFAGAVVDPIVLLAITVVGFTACGMVWNAARVFHGRKPSWIGMTMGGGCWVAAYFGLPAISGTNIHVILGAAIVTAYAALTAYELSTERRKALKARWPAISGPVLHGIVLMLPIVIGDALHPYEFGLSGKSIWIAIFAIELVLYSMVTAFIIFMLVSERAVIAHKTAASIDPLTGLLNRRGFSEATSRMIEREEKAGRPVTVLIFDIDHFKSINDRFGHPTGDEILKMFSNVVTNSLRITDLTGRIGGEEFAALLPCSPEEAVLVADRVREAFQTCGVAIDDVPLATTVSIGVSGGPPGTELDVLLAAADTALYQAKRGGRNRVEVATEEPLDLEDSRKKKLAAQHAQPRAPQITANEIALAQPAG